MKATVTTVMITLQARRYCFGTSLLSFKSHRESHIDKTEMSAGVTPLTRAAWPKVTGRTFESFCRVSELNAGICLKSKPSGIRWEFLLDTSLLCRTCLAA